MDYSEQIKLASSIISSTQNLEIVEDMAGIKLFRANLLNQSQCLLEALTCIVALGRNSSYILVLPNLARFNQCLVAWDEAVRDHMKVGATFYYQFLRDLYYIVKNIFEVQYCRQYKNITNSYFQQNHLLSAINRITDKIPDVYICLFSKRAQAEGGDASVSSQEQLLNLYTNNDQYLSSGLFNNRSNFNLNLVDSLGNSPNNLMLNLGAGMEILGSGLNASHSVVSSFMNHYTVSNILGKPGEHEKEQLHQKIFEEIVKKFNSYNEKTRNLTFQLRFLNENYTIQCKQLTPVLQFAIFYRSVQDPQQLEEFLEILNSICRIWKLQNISSLELLNTQITEKISKYFAQYLKKP